MSKNTSNGSEGNDGSWFLEAIGAKPKSGSPSEAVAGLTAENTIPDLPVVPNLPIDSAPTRSTPSPTSEVIVHATFDGDPGTSTSSFHPVPTMPPPPDLEHPPSADGRESDGADTSDLPALPPSTADEVGIDDTQLSPALRSRRNFRWPVVVVLVVLIAAVGVAAWWLPQSVRDQALVTRQSYYDAAADLRNELPDSQQALDAITNPASSAEAIAAAVPSIAELDRLAFDLEAVTAEPLPQSFPVIPSTPIDELVPLRDTGAILGASASDLSGRLGQSYVYRTSIPSLLDTGPLPATATTQEVNAISVRLAESLATDAGIVADLPEDPAFTATLVAAVAAVDRYAEWQDEYLSALTSEDADAAGRLVSDLELLRTALNETNQSDLLGFRSEADQWIIRLAGELEAYMTDLSRD